MQAPLLQTLRIPQRTLDRLSPAKHQRSFKTSPWPFHRFVLTRSEYRTDSVFAVTDIDERITDKVTPEQLNLAMLFQRRGVKISRQSAEIQVTRPGFRHPEGVERAARTRQVSDCSGSYGVRHFDDNLASILLSKDISRGTMTPLPLRRRIALC